MGQQGQEGGQQEQEAEQHGQVPGQQVEGASIVHSKCLVIESLTSVKSSLNGLEWARSLHLAAAGS